MIREGSIQPTTQPAEHQAVLEIKELPLPAEEPEFFIHHSGSSRPQAAHPNEGQRKPYAQIIKDYRAHLESYRLTLKNYQNQLQEYKSQMKKNPGMPIPLPQFRPPALPAFAPETAGGPWTQEPVRTLELALRGPAGRVMRQVRFLDKPWADNFGEFVARDANKNWRIGRSPRPCGSESEAHDQAITNAAGQLYPSLRDQLQNSSYGWPIKTFNETYEEATLLPFLRPTGTPRADPRPVHPAFLAAVWNRGPRSPPRGCLARQHPRLGQPVSDRPDRGEDYLGRTSFPWSACSILICIVYAFINAATKGYYTWSLRMAAVVIGVLIVALVVFMA